jgi:hypothetical protein
MSLRTTLVFLALLFAQRGRARAQAPQIGAVWPPGGMRGAKVAANVEGANLAGATSVLISGKGVKAQLGSPVTNAASIPLTLDIAPDAGPGPYEVRVITPLGVSNPGYLWIGAVPETAEVEPNNQPEQSMKLDKLPTAVYGRINAPEDVDWYTFKAEAGDTYVFDICSNRLYSPLDAALDLRDAKGLPLGSAMVGYDRDPRLIYTFKRAGDYRIQVRDTQYRGGGNFIYKLTLGKLPVITSMMPPAGKRGETLSAKIEGFNLGGDKTVSIPLPPDMPENKTYWALPQTAGGTALPIAVAGNDDVQMERPEPLAQAPELKVYDRPTSVNGHLANARQVETYRFAGEAGKPLQIGVVARSMGSRMMPYVRLLDPSGKELLTTEDQIGRDPSVYFVPPATGIYRLELSSVDAQGGPDYTYRLTFRPPGSPDFRLNASPDIISIGKGQTAAINIGLDRIGGFGGDVAVKTEGLPAGMVVSPLIIGAGQNSGIITITAAPGAAPGSSGAIRFIGSSNAAMRLEHPATPIASLPRPGEGQVVSRAVNFQAVTATAAVPLYTLSMEPAQVTLMPGQTVMVKVRAARKPGDNNANPAIALTLANLPPGVTAETPAIAEKQGEVTIKLVAAANAGPAVQSALLTGKLNNDVQAAPALQITVKPK